MDSLIVLVLVFNILVTQVNLWDISDNYYDKDYDKNKDCKEEERIVLLNDRKVAQCLSFPWGEGSHIKLLYEIMMKLLIPAKS